MGKIAMNSKFRFYVILAVGTSAVFLFLYKTLESENQDSESHLNYMHKTSRFKSPKSGTFININDLLPVTQSPRHLERQRLKEAQVHANIKNSAFKSGIFKFSSKNELLGDEVEIDHPSKSVNERVSNGIRAPRPKEVIHFSNKFVHLDLKGAPPILSYYKMLFPLLRSLGANGVLMEYEDMFPFHGPIEQLSARNAYSRNELAEILYLAKINELEVMPLIQVFGHMEFVLKLQAYQDLREVPAYPQVICPSNNGTQILLRQVIDQVMSLHPNIKWLHIGSDEVRYVQECDLCRHRMRTQFMDKEDLFINHIKNVAKYIKERYSVRLIMWGDVLCKFSDEKIRISEVWKFVNVMAWQYSPSAQPDALIKYGKYFSGIWAASAFKGTTKVNQYLTDISHHLENLVSWIHVLFSHRNEIPFEGFILTGWQRYDHFSVLCELLPVAIPSLAINLVFLEKQVVDNDLFEKVQDILKCESRLKIHNDYSMDEALCDYPGSNVLKGIQRLKYVSDKFKKFLSSHQLVGWISDYNIKMSFSNPEQVEIATKNVKALYANVTLVYTFLQNAMLDVYDEHTINEWMMTYVEPLSTQVGKFRIQAHDLLKFRVWPRRPLNKTQIPHA